jgi:hypothetical protein
LPLIVRFHSIHEHGTCWMDPSTLADNLGASLMLEVTNGRVQRRGTLRPIQLAPTAV